MLFIQSQTNGYRMEIGIMNVPEMHHNWNDLANQDAKWAILTHADKKNNQWDTQEFFQTGQDEVNRDLNYLAGLNLHLEFGRALDFGCGIGRLSQALAIHFQEVHGVDVSSSMIEQANSYNTHSDRVKYFVNTEGTLTCLNEFQYDFVYSLICLQHIPAPYQGTYISEFMRLLIDGGFAMFQTIHAISWRKLVPNFMVEAYRHLRYKDQAYIPIYGINPNIVKKIVKSHHCALEDHITKPYDSYTNRWRIDTYIVSKS